MTGLYFAAGGGFGSFERRSGDGIIGLLSEIMFQLLDRDKRNGTANGGRRDHTANEGYAQTTDLGFVAVPWNYMTGTSAKGTAGLGGKEPHLDIPKDHRRGDCLEREREQRELQMQQRMYDSHKELRLRRAARVRRREESFVHHTS